MNYYNAEMIKYIKTDDILCDMCGIINSSQKQAYRAVNYALVRRNWLIGYRIAEEELKGEKRAEYGIGIIKQLSKELSKNLRKRLYENKFI